MPTHQPPGVDAIAAVRPKFPVRVPATNGGPVPVLDEDGKVRVGIYKFTARHALDLSIAVACASQAAANRREP